MTLSSDRLKELTAINRAIAGSLDCDEVLDLVVEKTAVFTGAEACLLLFASCNDQVSVVASWGVDPERARAFSAPLNEEIGDRVTNVLQFGREVTLVGKPLVINKTVSGMLIVYRRAAAPEPDSDDEFLFGALADQATIALAHALRFRDDRERLLERERAARAEAEGANRAKDEFLAIVSHELRTPLNAVIGFTRMLRRGALLEARREHALEAIERNAVAQAQLIEDLLDVSRIISESLRLEVRPVDLLEVIEAAAQSVRPAMEAKETHFEMDVDAQAGLLVGDPDRLQQVVSNLLGNSTKFTPKGGHVLLRVRSTEDEVELSVIDDGHGIEASFLPMVFDRFRQADVGSTRAHGGLGLGLHICRHLTAMHGGTITAQSAGRGLGSTFTIKLPRSGPSGEQLIGWPAPMRKSVAPERQPELTGLKILVVDDEADARELFVTLLEERGAAATAVGSTADALAMIRKETPDVIVSDISMPGPGGDGYALIRELRSLPPWAGGNIPAAAVTAHATSDHRRKAILAGYQMHLAKPFDPAELVNGIANLANAPKSSRPGQV